MTSARTASVRVLHVITGLGVGGAETQLELLTARTRHEVRVVCLYDFGRTGRRIRAGGVPATSLELPNRHDPRTLIRLVRLMRRHRCDVVHVHLFRAALYGRVAARLAGVPVVVTTEHSLGRAAMEGQPLTSRVQSLYLATERLGDATIAVSDHVRRLLIDWGVPAHRIVVIPNGIDFARFAFDRATRSAVRRDLSIPDAAIVVGSVGRLVAGKRHARVIDAVAELHDDRIWVVLVGNGPERTRLLDTAARQGLADRCLVLGARDDVSELLAAMDVFASVGEEETFGLAPLEAVASGLPAVVSHAPALAGLGAPSVTWVTGEVDSIASGLRSAMARGPGRLTPPDEAREAFDADATVRRIDDFYEQLLAQRSGRRR